MKSLLFLLLLFCILPSAAQKIEAPKVDKRVELVGVVFRLAGAPEYSLEDYKDYADAVNRHFGAYRNHRAVGLAKKLHETGAGYSYVAALALHLENLPKFRLAAPLEKTDATAFGSEKNIREFIDALKDFYAASDFEKFWADNQARFDLAEKNFVKLAEDFHPEWYEEFYGQKFKGRFKVVIGMGNGRNFYATSVERAGNSRDLYTVFAPLPVNNEPRLPSNALSFTVHEFNHSFANPLIEKYAARFEAPAAKLFQKARNRLPEAYGTWRIMMYESLVRAATGVYLLKYNPNLVAGNRASDMFEQNFLWVDAFTDLLKTYQADRRKYPNLESFVPQMVGFFERTADADLETFRTEFDKNSAHVVKLEPFANGAQNVDAETGELRIIFDKPLAVNVFSVNVSEQKDEEFPEVVGGRKGIAFSQDGREFTMKIKLKPNTKYGLVLSGGGFQTTDGYPLKNYKITFQTGSK